MSKKIHSLMVVATLLAFGLALAGFSPALAMHEHEHLHVMVDVKPGSFPNPINLRSQGVVPVALFGSPDFDVTQVDTGSVKFGPMHQHELGAPAVGYSYQDVNADGLLDIVFKFRTQETGLTPADMEACLHGMTMGGEHFCGHDLVVVRE